MLNTKFTTAQAGRSQLAVLTCPPPRPHSGALRPPRLPLQPFRAAAPEQAVVEGDPPRVADPRQSMENSMQAPAVPGGETRVPWWNKPVKGAEHLKEITNLEELQQAFSQSFSSGKSVAIDFFAGNCPSCRAAYPKLCSIAKDGKLRETFNFYKANVQDPTLFWWIKRNSVTTIPFFLVYSPEGAQVLGTTASFKRMPVIKEGMYTIQANPQAKKFAMNPEKTKIEVVH